MLDLVFLPLLRYGDAMLASVRRVLVLPERGTLLVSTDLHGAGDDFRAMRRRFLDGRAADPETHWALLGDTVHGPDEGARRMCPELYDYDDESGAIVEEILALEQEHAGHVHYVLGNHDLGHVGGPHTRKFHDDEVAHLEARLDAGGRAALRELFGRALLAVVAPCGALLAHGSPGAGLRDLADLDRIVLPMAPDSIRRGTMDPYLQDVLESWLTSYGQHGDSTARLLEVVSRSVGRSITFVAYGHDRDEAGFYTTGKNQICVVMFGAPRREKRYLRLDLGARYRGVDDLAEGREILRVYDL